VRKQVTVPLRKPLQSPKGPVKQIVLREPTFDEYFLIGDPYSIAYTQSGTGFAVENAENIRRYIDACVVEPEDPAILVQGDALLAKEVKIAMLGFFQPPGEADSDSATSETDSPSAEAVPTSATSAS
jgi:hypothetical protein